MQAEAEPRVIKKMPSTVMLQELRRATRT